MELTAAEKSEWEARESHFAQERAVGGVREWFDNLAYLLDRKQTDIARFRKAFDELVQEGKPKDAIDRVLWAMNELNGLSSNFGLDIAARRAAEIAAAFKVRMI